MTFSEIIGLRLLRAKNSIIEQIKSKLLEDYGYDSWEEFIANQDIGECQTIVSFIAHDFPQAIKVFGEIELDEPYIDEEGAEQYLATHHWVEINGELFDFSKGTLKELIDWNDLYSIDVVGDEWRYNKL